MNFFDELKRRNVFKVAAAYIIVAWLLLQVSDTLVPALRLPDWFHSGVAFILIMGFPVAMIFAWAYELTPDGLKKEKEIGDSESIASTTGRKLNNVVMGSLILAVGYFAFDKFVREPQTRTLETQMDQVVDAESGSIPESEIMVVDDRSIAVLPFANRSNLEDDLFFTDGIHDDLLTQLAKISDLRVISRTSVMAYRDTSKKIPEIATELGVSRILEGGIQRAGDRVRINAQLIDVHTDEHLWAETFDREMTVENIFEIQSEITRQIVTAVRGELSSAESESLSQLPTQNLQAYEAYMHAKAAINVAAYNTEKYIRAKEWAERSVILDPEFEWGWAMIVEAESHLNWQIADYSQERVESAKAALEKLLENDPQSSKAQSALGEYLYRIEGDYIGALAAFEKALSKQPGSATVLTRIGIAQRRIGNFEDAVSSFENALKLDPANPQIANEFLNTLLHNAEYEKGLAVAEETILRFPDEQSLRAHLALLLIHWKGDINGARALLDEMSPASDFSYASLATTLPLYEGNLDEALANWDLPELIKYSELSNNAHSWRDRKRGEIHLLLGNRSEAERILNNFIQNEVDNHSPVVRNNAFRLINLALAYALTEKPDQALEAMHEAQASLDAVSDGIAREFVDDVAIRVLALTGQHELALKEIERVMASPGGYATHWTLTLDPRWDFFRDNARFNELIKPLNSNEAAP